MIISLQAGAYSQKDIKLTQAEYIRWVKPQLSSITQDYQTLLGLLNPHITNLKTRFSIFKDISEKKRSFENFCQQAKNEKCIEVINVLARKIGELIKLSEKSELPEDLNTNSYRENTLHTFDHHLVFIGSLMDLLFQLQNLKFFYDADIPPITTPDFLNKKIEDSFNSFNFYILSSSDPRFFEAFTAYWNSFIRPVQSNVLQEKDKSHFLRGLNDFNLRWNYLHVELTKRNKKIPPSVTTLLTTMHNRWKIILRLTLR